MCFEQGLARAVGSHQPRQVCQLLMPRHAPDLSTQVDSRLHGFGLQLSLMAARQESMERMQAGLAETLSAIAAALGVGGPGAGMLSMARAGGGGHRTGMALGVGAGGPSMLAISMPASLSHTQHSSSSASRAWEAEGTEQAAGQSSSSTQGTGSPAHQGGSLDAKAGLMGHGFGADLRHVLPAGVGASGQPLQLQQQQQRRPGGEAWGERAEGPVILPPIGATGASISSRPGGQKEHRHRRMRNGAGAGASHEADAVGGSSGGPSLAGAGAAGLPQAMVLPSAAGFDGAGRLARQQQLQQLQGQLAGQGQGPPAAGGR